MIERIWRGVCREALAESYVNHLRQDTLPKLRGLKGFQKMEILRRETEAGVEFLVKTTWNSIQDIESFSGSDIKVAVVPQNVQNMMVSYDNFVSHYTLIDK